MVEFVSNVGRQFWLRRGEKTKKLSSFIAKKLDNINL